MAILQMGTRQINMSGGAVGFDPVPVSKRNAYFPSMSAIGISALDYGYLLCTFRVVATGFANELPETYKYFVGGSSKNARANIPDGLIGSVELQLVIYPIEIYAGKANPQVFDVTAILDDSVNLKI